MKTFTFYFLFALLAISTLGQNPTPLAVTLTPIISSGISNPIGIEFQGDKMFIVEQGGTIKIFENGNLLPNNYLDISSLISSGGERGLLGLAFDPDFENNLTLYLNYTNNSGNTVIASFIADADNLFVNPDTETILLSVNQPFTNHNGGRIAFGPDDYLYVGMGDGGDGGDPGNRAQNPLLLLGKVLRIDVTADGYTIPPTNPFANVDSTLDEIWALGVRNPWRFSFDPLTGNLWMGDVGQNQYEEINFQEANSPGGENYGWRCYEGLHSFNTDSCINSTLLDFPVFEYNHSGGSCSVTGGYVYRGIDSELLNGVYLFIDYCSGALKGLQYTVDDSLITYNFGNYGFGYVSFGQDKTGEMYLAQQNGTIYKVEDPCHSKIPELIAENNILSVEEGANYYWFLNGTEVIGENNSSLEAEQNGEYYCVVENEFGCNIQSNSVNVINVGLQENNPPNFKIYPNPFNTTINIDGDTKFIQSIYISDALGNIIWEQNKFISNPIKLPESLTPGIYILNIQSSSNSQVVYSTKVYKF